MERSRRELSIDVIMIIRVSLTQIKCSCPVLPLCLKQELVFTLFSTIRKDFYSIVHTYDRGMFPSFKLSHGLRPTGHNVSISSWIFLFSQSFFPLHSQWSNSEWFELWARVLNFYKNGGRIVFRLSKPATELIINTRTAEIFCLLEPPTVSIWYQTFFFTFMLD